MIRKRASALLLLYLLIAAASSAAEFRWSCSEVMHIHHEVSRQWDLDPTRHCEVVLDGKTGYARIYLPEPGFEGLAAGLVLLTALSRGRAARPSAPRSG